MTTPSLESHLKQKKRSEVVTTQNKRESKQKIVKILSPHTNFELYRMSHVAPQEIKVFLPTVTKNLSLKINNSSPNKRNGFEADDQAKADCLRRLSSMTTDQHHGTMLACIYEGGFFQVSFGHIFH
jgi:hypothetical protein